jgi:hypothetical protein
MPFEGTLVIRIYDARGHLAAEQPIIAEGKLGGPASFAADVRYGGTPGPGRIEVLEFSARDGSVVARAEQPVTLAGFQGGGYVEQPIPQAEVTLPIYLLARVGTPGEDLNVTVSWGRADEVGVQFAHVFTALRDAGGNGVVLVPLDWVGDAPAHPPTQNGAIEIHTMAGDLVAWQPVRILHPQDPGTMATNVYWVQGEEVVAQPLRIPRTLGIGRASLNALLWGPVPQNSRGYTTALPSPAEVVGYPGRERDWGERVRLQDLTIVDGVARADFSEEITAYAGGGTRVLLMREQIERTLLQFRTVNEVVITVGGQPDRLEP